MVQGIEAKVSIVKGLCFVFLYIECVTRHLI